MSNKVKTILTLPAKLKTRNDRLGLIKFLQENIDNEIEILRPSHKKAEPDTFTCIGRISLMVMENKEPVSKTMPHHDVDGEPRKPVHTPWQDQEP